MLLVVPVVVLVVELLAVLATVVEVVLVVLGSQTCSRPTSLATRFWCSDALRFSIPATWTATSTSAATIRAYSTNTAPLVRG